MVNVMDKASMHKRILALLVLALLFGIVSALAVTGHLLVFEDAVYAAVAQLINPSLTSIMLFVTDLGSGLTVSAVVVVLLLLPATRKTYGANTALASIIGGIAIFTLKELFARSRPQILELTAESDFALPSGHATISAVLFLTILFIAWHEFNKPLPRGLLLGLCICLPVIVGVSRVYLGVHYAGDVLAGWLLGAFIALLVNTVYIRFFAYRWQAQK